MRNPFPKIGKVIKYEFKHSSRILVPMYGVLLVLGLMAGLSFDKRKLDMVWDSMEATGNYEFYLEGQEAIKNMITFYLFVAIIALAVAISVVTVVTIARRFKQSMLGEEAYLNLSLPLTMGEQLWGRFLMDVLLMICCGVVIFLTFILCFIRFDIFNEIQRAFITIRNNLNNISNNENVSIGGVLSCLILLYISFSCWVTSMVFVVNAISHILKNNKGFIKFIVVIVLIWINGKCLSMIPTPNAEVIFDRTIHYFMRKCVLVSGISLLLSAVYFGFTQFVFTKKLNLE